MLQILIYFCRPNEFLDTILIFCQLHGVENIFIVISINLITQGLPVRVCIYTHNITALAIKP